MTRYSGALLSCLLLWLLQTSPALGWGALGHAVTGYLVEHDLLSQDPRLQSLLRHFRDPTQYRQVRAALLGMDLPGAGKALPALANWPDWYKRQPGMLLADERRHYVNLPFTARYERRQHCPDDVCSIETLLEQRAILADRRARPGKRAVALAWVAHLVGDIHQPLHAGRAEDRGGNLTCVVWMGQPSRLLVSDGRSSCTGANLHAVWDYQLIEAATGFGQHDDAPALARQLRPLLARLQTAEPPLTARTPAEWRAVVERWHHETQALIVQEGLYPADGEVGPAYLQRHYPTVRQQLLRAAVRLAALLRHALADPRT